MILAAKPECNTLLQARRDRFGREQRYAYAEVENMLRDSLGVEHKLSYPWPVLTQITDGVGRRYQLHYGALHAKAWDAEAIKNQQEKSASNPAQATANGFKDQAGWQPDSGWRLTQISVQRYASV